jgi:hypothetical protein
MRYDKTNWKKKQVRLVDLHYGCYITFVCVWGGGGLTGVKKRHLFEYVRRCLSDFHPRLFSFGCFIDLMLKFFIALKIF